MKNTVKRILMLVSLPFLFLFACVFVVKEMAIMCYWYARGVNPYDNETL